MFIKSRKENSSRDEASEVLGQLFDVALKFYPYRMPVIQISTLFGSGSLRVHIKEPLKIPFVVPSMYHNRKYLIIYDVGYTLKSVEMIFLYGKVLRATFRNAKSEHIYIDWYGDIALAYLAHPKVVENIADVQSDMESVKHWFLQYIDNVKTVVQHDALRYINPEDLLDKHRRSGNVVYIGHVAVGINGYVKGAIIVTRSFRGILRVKNGMLIINADPARYVQNIVDAIATLRNRIKMLVDAVTNFFEAYKRFRVAYTLMNI